MKKTNKKPAVKKSAPKKKAFRYDAYVNTFSGLGSRDRDKAVLSSFERNLKLSDSYLENLYSDNDVAARICDALPESMVQRGFLLKFDDEEYSEDLDEYIALEDDPESEAEKKVIRQIMMKMDDLGAREKYLDAMIWSRVFGGAGLYVGIDDGNSQEEEINEARIQDVTFLKVLDKRNMYPFEYYEDVMHPKFGQPKNYKLIPNVNQAFFSVSSQPEAVVHETRIIPFNGTRTTPQRARENQGWSDSILQKCDEVLAQFGQAWQATSHLMTDAAQGIFKMAGLLDALHAQSPEYISRRLQDMDMNRSIARMLAVDAESGEDFKRDTYSFNGIPQILELFMLRLSLAARIPVTILMGQSPSGMNATGESDIRWFYDTVKTAQRDVLKPRLERLIRLIMLSKKGPTRGREPEEWAVCFPSPWQMNDFERAEINKTRAETKQILAAVNAGTPVAQYPTEAAVVNPENKASDETEEV